MLRRVAGRQAQIERSRKSKQAIWRSIGVLGTIGWSITIPTILGIALGIWLDAHVRAPFSWTLTLLALGLVAGCVIAWQRIKKEQL
jgi:ATP synthase protein I